MLRDKHAMYMLIVIQRNQRNKKKRQQNYNILFSTNLSLYPNTNNNTNKKKNPIRNYNHPVHPIKNRSVAGSRLIHKTHLIHRYKNIIFYPCDNLTKNSTHPASFFNKTQKNTNPINLRGEFIFPDHPPYKNFRKNKYEKYYSTILSQ